MLNPFGTEATFLAAAQIVSTIMNVNRKKGAQAISPADIVPDFVGTMRQQMIVEAAQHVRDEHDKAKRQTTQEQIAIVEQLNVMFGGRDLRDEKVYG